MAQGLGPRGQAGGQRGAVEHWQLRGQQPRQPGFLVGREDGVRCPAAGEDLAALEDHVVLAGVQGNAQAGQRAAHAGIARLGLRLVVVCGIHGLHTQGLGQGGQRFGSVAVLDDQASFFLPGQRAQVRIQLEQGGPDELHPAVAAWQRVQNVPIENEGAIDALALLQGQVQGRVVVDPQVAPEPDQTGIQGFLHIAVKIETWPMILHPSTSRIIS